MVKCNCGKTVIIFSKGKEQDSFHASINIAADNEKKALRIFQELVKDPEQWTRKLDIEKQLDRDNAQRRMASRYIGPSMYT